MIKPWHEVFMEMAQVISQRSKDPHTQVGCVITDSKNRVVSVGFNGFPAGCDDFPWARPEKYDYVIHAEANALMFANPVMEKHTLYSWPLGPCNECAKLIVQSGIKRVVYPKGADNRDYHRIAEKIFQAKQMEVIKL